MLVSILASGSKGNCTYVETNDIKLLIDVGMNTKYITERLNELGVQPEEIDAIVMTHTHGDHTVALKVFAKKYTPQIVLTEGMLEDLDFLKDYGNLLVTEGAVVYGQTKIEPFKTSHDSTDPRGYLIEDGESSVVYMTDTGYLNQRYFEKLKNKNVYIIEANHDVEMLINGPYPKETKSRILSDVGHLSNNAAGFYLSKLIGPDTKKVYLAHLSETNNTEEEALKTVRKTLAEYEIDFDDIEVAKQREKTKEIKI